MIYQSKELLLIKFEQIVARSIIIILKNIDILSGVFKRIIYKSNL